MNIISIAPEKVKQSAWLLLLFSKTLEISGMLFIFIKREILRNTAYNTEKTILILNKRLLKSL